MAITATAHKTQNAQTYSFSGVDTPEDILYQIFSKLTQLNGFRTNDIHSLLLTNRNLNLFVSNWKDLWNNLLQKHFPGSLKKSPCPSNSYPLYKHNKNVENNLGIGKCRKFFVNRFSPSPVLAHGEKLVFTSGNTITVWNHNSGKELFTIIWPRKGDCDIVLHENTLFFGCGDGTILRWDLENGSELPPLKGHQNRITRIFVQEDKLISSSKDSIKVWNLNEGKELLSIDQWPIEERCILVHDGKLIFVSRCSFIKVWDINNKTELFILNAPNCKFNSVRRVIMHENTLISRHENGTIKGWNFNDQAELFTLSGPSGDHDMFVHEDKLISFGSNCIKVWDFNHQKELFTINTELSNSIHRFIHDGKIINGSNKGYIQVCDLNNGKELCWLKDSGWLNNIFSFGKILISNSWCQSTGPISRIWDLDKKEEVCKLSHGIGFAKVLMHDSKLIFKAQDNCSIEICDFDVSSLSPYNKQTLENNLSILGKMAHAEFNGIAADVEALAKTLHSDFQKRLNQPPFTKEVILRVQMEVCLELLLDRIYYEDQKRVSELLNHLVWIDNRSTKLYENLERICRKKEGEKWGERAFHGHPDYPASFQQKEKAVLEFKEFLKE